MVLGGFVGAGDISLGGSWMLCWGLEGSVELGLGDTLLEGLGGSVGAG